MSAATASDLERYMLDLMNEERTSRGLNALVLDRVLNASADAHSEWMLDNNVFSHSGVNGSRFRLWCNITMQPMSSRQTSDSLG